SACCRSTSGARTYYKRACGIQGDAHGRRDPCYVRPCRISENEHPSRCQCSRKNARNKAILRLANAVLHCVWLVDEPHQSAVYDDTEACADDDADEHCAHDADGKAVCSKVDDWERFEEGVLDMSA